MSDESVESILKSLIEDFQKPEIRSRQAVVDLNINSIEYLRKKRMVSLKFILSIVNEKTNLNLKLDGFKSMVYRSLKKNKLLDKNNNNVITKNTVITEKQNNKDKRRTGDFSFNPTPDKEKLNKLYDKKET